MADIGQWLRRHGLGKYAEAFLANDIDIDILSDLSEQDLNELGVSLGDRRRLRQLISGDRFDRLRFQQSLIDSLPEQIAYLNADETYGFVNKAYEKWYPWAAEDIVGRPVREVLPEGYYPKVHQNIQAALAGKSVTFESDVVHCDGRRRWVQVQYVPDVSDDGTIPGVFALISDLTEQHEMTLRLQESEQRFRDLIENAIQGIVILDESDRPVFVNRAAADVFGHTSPDDILALGSLAPLVCDPMRLPELLACWECDLSEDSRPRMHEMEGRRKDGSQVWLQAQPRLIEWTNKKALQLTIVDITQQKQAEARLKLREAQLEALFNNAPIVIGLKSVDGRWQRVNRHYSKIIGSTEDQIVGKRSTEVFEEAIATAGEELDEAVRVTRSAASRIIPNPTVDGLRNFLQIKFPICDSDGELRQIGLFALDMSEHDKLQQDLRISEERFRDFANAASDWFWEVDEDLRFTYVSPSFERETGTPSVDMIGMSMLEIAQERYPDGEFGEFLALAAERKECRDLVLRCALSEQPDKWVALSAVPIFHDDGSFGGYRGAVKDVTEQKQARDALQLSQAQLFAIFDHAPIIMGLKDRDGRWLRANKELLKVAGLSKEEILGRHSSMVFPQEIAQPCIDLDSELLESGNVSRRYFDIATSGQVRTLQEMKVPVRGPDGQVEQIALFSVDVTEQIAIEEALRKNQALLLDAQRIGNIGHWERDYSTETIVWSDQVFRIFGLEPGERHPTVAEFKKFIHPDDLPAYDEVARQTQGGLSSFDLEHRIVRADGQVGVVRERAEIVRDEDGGLLRVFGTVQDITEARQAEQSILDQEARFRAVVDNSPFSLLLKRTDGSILLVNRTYERWFGVDRRDFIGQRATGALSPDLLSELQSLDTLVLADRKPVEILKPIRFADGRNHQLRLTKFPVSGTDGTIVGIGTIGVDETDRLLLEQRLRQGEKMQAVGHLTGGVAHEFNNMMQIILSNAELLIDRVPDDPVMHRQLDAMRRTAQRGSELTGRLLAFSRRQALRPRATQVAELAGECVELLRQTIGPSITITSEFQSDLWPVEVDQTELQNAIVNLVFNARDAIERSGCITLVAGNHVLADADTAVFSDVTAGDYVRLSITDTGPGMAPEVRAHAFEPFFTTKDVGTGTGLGLSMVYGFARQSGGFAEIESVPGQGTTVSIYLPRLDAVEQGQRPGEAAPEPGPKRKLDILVVEDDPDVRHTLAEMLKAQGYGVEAAVDATAALERLAQEPGFDLVISDVMMPGEFNGFDVARRIKECRPRTQLLLITGYSDLDGEPAALREAFGDIGLLRKPFDKRDLTKAIGEVLARPA